MKTLTYKGYIGSIEIAMKIIAYLEKSLICQKIQ